MHLDVPSTFQTPLTSQCQKWVIYIALVFINPGQQLLLNISCSPFRMVLAQLSCATYEVINPVLGIGIFDAVLGLLILYSLCDTQASQFNLVLYI